jgi:hypothetical protein
MVQTSQRRYLKTFLGYVLRVANMFKAGIVKISQKEASKMRYRTAAVIDQPGYYIAGIEMYHQLHCLVSTCPHVAESTSEV